ncbi:MAG: Hpt domain-containing protein [Lachnospiraceae bacterium]|nr:Hpt domain-containing protein [Lachnospiraceae bacterium]
MSLELNRDDMLDTYVLETTQILDDLQALVLKCKDESGFSEDAVAVIFRYMHTLKGSAGFMMFEQLNLLTHKTEDIFYYIREHKPAKIDQAYLVELVLKVSDFIQGELDRLSDGKMADSDATALIEEQDAFLRKIMSDNSDKTEDDADPKQSGTSGDASGDSLNASSGIGGDTRIYIAPKDTKANHYFQIYIVYNKDTKMANVHAYKVVHLLRGVADDIKYTPENILTSEASGAEILEKGFKILLRTSGSKSKLTKLVSEGYETETIEITEIDAARFEAGFKLFGVDAPVAAKITKKDEDFAPGDFVVHSGAPGKGKFLAKDREAKKDKGTHINVEASDMDRLADLIIKLIKAQNKLIEDKEVREAGLELAAFDRNADKIKVITSEIQNLVTTMRMVSFTNIFLRMNRVIFEASRKLGKDIECVIIGDDVKADRGIIEHISDPLMHMVRNCADHGIEEANERMLKGKPMKGRITLKAEIKDDELLVSVSDDGAGLNRDKILKKAHEKNLIPGDKSDSEYTDDEVWKFITLPGFSTNAEVTEFSGRGVGMDVVVSAVETIGGSLSIESKKDQGSTMTMKFKL